jgi:hypothetical protein
MTRKDYDTFLSTDHGERKKDEGKRQRIGMDWEKEKKMTENSPYERKVL